MLSDDEASLPTATDDVEADEDVEDDEEMFDELDDAAGMIVADPRKRRGSRKLSGSPMKPFGDVCAMAAFFSAVYTFRTPLRFCGLPCAAICSAAAPAACGAAMLVPLIVEYPPPRHAESMHTPGAAISTGAP